MFHKWNRKRKKLGAKPPMKPAKAGIKAFQEKGRKKRSIQDPPDPFPLAKVAAKAAGDKNSQVSSFLLVF